MIWGYFNYLLKDECNNDRWNSWSRAVIQMGIMDEYEKEGLFIEDIICNLRFDPCR